jgi:hypothetical protein
MQLALVVDKAYSLTAHSPLILLHHDHAEEIQCLFPRLTLFPSVTDCILATRALKRAVLVLSEVFTMDLMRDLPLSNVNCWTMDQSLPRVPHSQSLSSHQYSPRIWLALIRWQTHCSLQCSSCLLRPITRQLSILSPVLSPSADNLCQMTISQTLLCLKNLQVFPLRERKLLSGPRKRLSFTTSLGY